ncbi:CdaR family protein [Mesobacillus subterraneus]|uniref:CdaR family protein n=1 Tax=Mesobacillus subterraneus TaxID=285983 RepID=UPI00203D9CEC|nr:CdaR family protein [Mesobacillus subterraneus]MCM3666812.1 CdaR family protein [Mesobacillus subterraneus]MCM3685706.1 CdaR family protein [Mesobacillus subterraneus]
MDKLMDSPWFIKVVALVLAVLLFGSVPKNDPDKPGDVNVPSDEKVETIEEVPVKRVYDTDTLVVSGVPETVSVTLQGPKNLVQQAKTLRNFEVFVDLTDAEMGKQRVPITIKDISDRLTVTIEPGYANVSVQEKVTKEFKVEAEFSGSIVEEGYIAEKPTVKPNKVQITGAKDVVDKITYVKATVNSSGKISETITREASVLVLDKEMNKLDVNVEPQTVDVTIPVKSSSKKVPIDIVRKGTSPSGVTIDSITLDTKEAEIIANPDVLDKVESARVEVDISKIDEDTEITLPVIIANGVVKVSPETVKVSVNVTTETEKTISNIPIEIEGMDDGYDVDFLNPANGQTNIIVSGPSDIVSPLAAGNFKILINVSGLDEGEHEVDLKVTAPQNITWKLDRGKANISVARKEA